MYPATRGASLLFDHVIVAIPALRIDEKGAAGKFFDKVKEKIDDHEDKGDDDSEDSEKSD